MKRCRSGVMMHLQVWGKKTPRANPERTWTSNDLQKTSGKATINGRRRSTSRVERPHDPEAAPQRPPRSGLVQRFLRQLSDLLGKFSLDEVNHVPHTEAALSKHQFIIVLQPLPNLFLS